MAKPKKNAPSKKPTKSKNTKKTAPKKAAAKKASSKKTTTEKKAAGKKTGKKNTAEKKKITKAPVKKASVKKTPPKKAKAPPKKAAKVHSAPQKAPPKEIKPVKKPATKPEAKESKKSASKPAPIAKTASKPAVETKAIVTKTPSQTVAPKSDNKRDQLRKNIIGGKKALRPTAFTLDEAREIAKTVAKTNGSTDTAPAASKTPAAPSKPDLNKLAKTIAPIHVKAASLADILGFNPKKAQKPTLFANPDTIPEKYRRYYKLLIDLRTSLTEGLSLHTEETLRRSTKDDAGDLSSYGQHMADAGTDTFDRDFALSMVANEQEALTEIDAAIKRIENGNYGVCEITQKPIAKERLLAVPFTRYSAEAQKEIEKNRMRVRTAAGLFGEGGDDSGRGDDGGGGEDE